LVVREEGKRRRRSIKNGSGMDGEMKLRTRRGVVNFRMTSMNCTEIIVPPQQPTAATQAPPVSIGSYRGQEVTGDSMHPVGVH
jgi:hypothetical protein